MCSSDLIWDTRHARGISAADIARALDVSPAYVSDVEHGRRKLTRLRTPVVEKLLGIQIGTLDAMYGTLPWRVAIVVEDDPRAAMSLAGALAEWRMVNERGGA